MVITGDLSTMNMHVCYCPADLSIVRFLFLVFGGLIYRYWTFLLDFMSNVIGIFRISISVIYILFFLILIAPFSYGVKKDNAIFKRIKPLYRPLNSSPHSRVTNLKIYPSKDSVIIENYIFLVMVYHRCEFESHFCVRMYE